MLKRIWNTLTDADDDTTEARPGLDRDSLKMLAEHFAIGRKMRYFPEYQRDIVFHTIIIAYRVNDHFIYSREAIRYDAKGQPSGFLLGNGKASLAPERVTKLQLMVPDTSDMERSLDYIRRANLGRRGQFVRGNAISLMADACLRGLPSVDTEVDGRIDIKDGPYQGNPMILLRPDLSTLRIVDQRQKARVPSDMPVNLYLDEDAPPVASILADFSDISLRLKPGPGAPALPPMKANEKVTVTLDFGDSAHVYRIRGIVFRAAADSCVVKLRQLYKDGEFVEVQTMDALEIKTSLLNRSWSGSSMPDPDLVGA